MTPTHWWDGQVIGQETSLPPLYTGWEWPQGCCPYYRTAYKKYSKTFVVTNAELETPMMDSWRNTNDSFSSSSPPPRPPVSHGVIYRPILEECERELAKNTAPPGNHLLPAFYQTVVSLVKQQQQQQQQDQQEPPIEDDDFRLVFRTFGSDLEDVARRVTELAQGHHPEYPGFVCSRLELSNDRLFQGRWKKSAGRVTPRGGVEQDTGHEKEEEEEGKNGPLDESASSSGSSDSCASYYYELWDIKETKVLASGDEAILEFLKQFPVCGIRDDYSFWAKNHWNPLAGKPVWVPSYERGRVTTAITTTTTTDGNNDITNEDNNKDERINNDGVYDHHLFFDDNIHNLAHDGIVCVRRQESHGSSYHSLDGATANQHMHGVHMVRVPTIEPVLNPGWYLGQIGKARDRLQERLRKARTDEV